MTSDRPTNRVEAAGRMVPGRPAAKQELAGGRLAATKRRWSYLTVAGLDALRHSLTERDWAVLDTVHAFGMASGPQLARLHFGDSESDARAARRALSRLRDGRVLDVLERRIGGVRAGSSGLVYRLGQAGVRLLGGHRLDEPGQHHLLHTLAIVDVFADLRVAQRQGALEVVRFDAEPGCWRSYLGRHGEPAVLKPDAYVELRLSGRRRLWFLEVDRGTVSTTTLKRKLARYAEYLDSGQEQAARAVFPRVVWATPSSRRSAHLAGLITAENERLGAELHRLLPDEWVPP